MRGCCRFCSFFYHELPGLKSIQHGLCGLSWGYPAGGVSDILAHLVARRLSERLGEAFVQDAIWSAPRAAADYVRFCFADPTNADAFMAEFGASGLRLSHARNETR